MRSIARAARQKYPRNNIVPFWLLCYWKLVRTEAEGDYAKAWKMLPHRLPTGVPCPTIEVLAVALVDHGLADR